MFRKTSGSILCPSCGRLTNADAAICLVCGRRNPGMWGFAGPLRVLFRSWSFTNVVTAVCVVLFLATIVLDPSSAFRPRGYLDVFSPSDRALQAFGAAGTIPWRYGYWWTIFTAIYLHGGLLHILFNVLWIRQLGPAVEEIYGPARLVVIFTVSGIAIPDWRNSRTRPRATRSDPHTTASGSCGWRISCRAASWPKSMENEPSSA